MSNQRNDKQEEFCHFSSVLITQWEAVLKFAVTETCSTQTAGSRYKKEKRKKKKKKKYNAWALICEETIFYHLEMFIVDLMRK